MHPKRRTTTTTTRTRRWRRRKRRTPRQEGSTPETRLPRGTGLRGC
jgi:hypothetical protein